MEHFLVFSFDCLFPLLMFGLLLMLVREHVSDVSVEPGDVSGFVFSTGVVFGHILKKSFQ